MCEECSKLKIITGNSHPELAGEIAAKLGAKLGEVEVGRFSDGEISVTIKECVRGCDVFIIQSTSYPVNENLMELLIMIDACKRASAKSIHAVIPYLGYARQDRKAKPRDPISAKLLANLIETAGASSILTMDLHAPQIQGFFDIPVNHLYGLPLLYNYFAEKLGNKDIVVVSPDVGSVTRARIFSKRLDSSLAIIDKRRQKANQSEVMNVIGEVEGKTAIIFDDLIDTGGTMVNAVKALKDKGAIEVYACCTHGVLSPPSIERIKESELEELVILNTVPIPKDKMISKIKVLSVGEIFAEVLMRVYNNVSISPIFD